MNLSRAVALSVQEPDVTNPGTKLKSEKENSLNIDHIAVIVWAFIILSVVLLQIWARLSMYLTHRKRAADAEPFHNETVTEGYDSARASVATDIFMNTFSWRPA
ncbi:Hypothetical predicted protein [Mytilus galloprovincialis]|uniref:Uncharacterized protein n=1 Tax=Mytilus galloprovincialis TaxID=29158 RepID=A0A8B6G9Z3_MYTGA|nr:Hypothetical predicted protein [Mytilus galloprovincialis]